MSKDFFPPRRPPCHFDERSEEKSSPRQAEDFSLSLEMTRNRVRVEMTTRYFCHFEGLS